MAARLGRGEDVGEQQALIDLRPSLSFCGSAELRATRARVGANPGTRSAAASHSASTRTKRVMPAVRRSYNVVACAHRKRSRSARSPSSSRAAVAASAGERFGFGGSSANAAAEAAHVAEQRPRRRRTRR